MLLICQIPLALAYLDPGTGSLFLQAIIGGVSAVIGAITLYWQKIKRFFKKEKKVEKLAANEGNYQDDKK